jgi:hypothetical protein
MIFLKTQNGIYRSFSAVNAQRMAHLSFAFILFTSLSAQAEYRVFELEIADSTNGSVRMTTTTLDDTQYRFYNPIKPSEKIAIKDTWMCYPRSDYFKKICPKPPPKPAKS